MRLRCKPAILNFADEKKVSWVIAANSAQAVGGGKSELHRAGCWITSSQRELKESATEIDRQRRMMDACG